MAGVAPSVTGSSNRRGKGPSQVFRATGPPPCAVGAGCGTPFVYTPTRFYAYWKQPGYVGCYGGPGNCYWRRDCWYDSFGHRFCS